MKKLFLLGFIVLSLMVTGVAQAADISAISANASKGSDTTLIRVYFTPTGSTIWSSEFELFASKDASLAVTCNPTYDTGASVSAQGSTKYLDMTGTGAGDIIAFKVGWKDPFTGVYTCSNTTTGYKAPAYKPASISASDGTSGNKISISWPQSGTSAAGGLLYQVQRSTSPGSGYGEVYSNTGLSFDDTSVVPGTTYYYKVRTINDSGLASDFTSADSGYAALASYTLTTNVSPAGAGAVSGNAGTYSAGSTASITATPNSGYSFKDWTGTNNNSSQSTTVTMNSSKTVTANFTALSSTPTLQTPAATACSSGVVNPVNLNWSGGSGPYWIGVIEGSRSTVPANSSSFWHVSSNGTSVASNSLYWWNGTANETSNKLTLKPSTTYSAWVWATTGGNSNVVQFTTPACTNVCTSWTYSAWSACSGGTQTRTVLTSSPAGCTGGSPVTSQTCSTGETTLNVASVPSGVAITGDGSGGTTPYPVTVSGSANISTVLTAPATKGSYTFKDWTGCNSTSGLKCTVTVSAGKTKTVTANYEGAIIPGGTCDDLDAGSWAPPSGSPSSANNRPSPLNVSGKSQSKSGCIGIGLPATTKPQVPLDVKGNVFIEGLLGATAIETSSLTVNGVPVTGGTSDVRLKTDINPLSKMLSKILQLKPVSFSFKDQSFYGSGPKFGLIAQEVEKVLPELVSTQADGYKRVDYSGAIAPLIQAIQEQQAQIEALNARIKVLEAR